MARTQALTPAQIAHYHDNGYLYPVQVLDSEQVATLRAAIDDHLAKRIRSERYELTDPVIVQRAADGTSLEYDESQASAEPTKLPFLFNLWKTDDRFRAVGLDRAIAGLAGQLLGTEDLLLFEDNVVVKTAGYGTLSWHQDSSYWPIATADAITVWIALDDVGPANGGLQVVPGSHRWEERLPVGFGDSQPLMQEFRPEQKPMPQDPAAEGHPVVTYEMKAGECGFHHPLLWHASTPNTSGRSRNAFILRYLPVGTIWLGNTRMPYEDVGCPPGEPLDGSHFPAVPR
jgi:ectoine hydroxylase-related dioxygenase (phytanoyl-CoA dioxygenase family)